MPQFPVVITYHCVKVLFLKIAHYCEKFYISIKYLLTTSAKCDKIYKTIILRRRIMEHIKTIETRNLCDSAKNGGCGECQTSCQSACKTSCGIANQKCEGNKESK